MNLAPQPPDGLLDQVRDNCAIADASVAGRFSLCGLLLRLRNLYKWERGLPPWQEQETSQVLEWVSRREQLWEEALEKQPQPLSLGGQNFDPFDTEGINRILAPLGLLYGAGLVGGGAPVFFLARQEKAWRIDGMMVHQLGEELTRDILFLPGLRQGSDIFLRRGPFPYLVWDLLADPRPSQTAFKRFALEAYGRDYREVITEPSWEALEPVLEGEMRAVLWHEMGEATDAAPAQELLAMAAGGHPGSDVEHFVRGIKDLMADCCPQGRLAQIAAHQSRGALGLYPVWQAGFLKLLFPEIVPAVQQFMAHGDWQAVEQARLTGWQKAGQAAEDLDEILTGYQGAEARTLVRRVVMEPLVGVAAPRAED
ncbi:MAG: hypothetical protein K9K65_08120 [Desulfarculaceae bacterium]|nr:hypothetical protein [Desulfarculaceae bacterium]MCF8047263.1 hypothetical protein [Desulfarculaceae bacterium]MCF8097792.1 hypothetical protein [Desulfarculaceae bacterium]MCF8122351.1 hypothetical protein [Desulfarculaceae bacterium]